MRLIDADEFKDYISEGYEQHKNELKTKEYRKLADGITKGFLLDIGEQPTAYDVDKVIKELEGWRDVHTYNNHDRLEAFQIAIDIVKRGGIE